MQSPIIPAPSSTSQLQMQSRKMRYDLAIRRLNEARKGKYPFDLVKELGEASSGPGNDAVRLLCIAPKCPD